MDRAEWRDLGRAPQRGSRRHPRARCHCSRRRLGLGRQQDRQLFRHSGRNAPGLSAARPTQMKLAIRAAEARDVPVVAELIRGLARFEKLEHEVTMTEARLTTNLFGPHRFAETLLAEEED